jgi:hypothetical protein
LGEGKLGFYAQDSKFKIQNSRSEAGIQNAGFKIQDSKFKNGF